VTHPSNDPSEPHPARGGPTLSWQRRVQLFIRGVLMIALGVAGILAYLLNR
jgi:hypothetical protein